MAQTIVQQTVAGPVVVMDVIQFAHLLFERNENILDIMVSKAIEIELLGAVFKPSRRKKNKQTTLKITALKDDLNYGQSSLSMNSSYVTAEFPMADIGDDIIGCIVKQLISVVEPYPDPKITDPNEAIEMAAINAMENFINATHVIKIKPTLLIAVDINDIKIKVADVDGIIKLAVYTEKLCSFKGLEVPNVIGL